MNLPRQIHLRRESGIINSVVVLLITDTLHRKKSEFNYGFFISKRIKH